MTFLAILLATIVGAIFHWVKKRYRGQTLSSLGQYLLVHKDATIRAFTAIFAAATGMYVADLELNGQTLAQAFTLGFGLDSLFNKSPEEK